MEFGVCILSIVPIRREGTDQSEIITQMLFGEVYTVTEMLEKWVYIKTQYDSYEGWICRKQYTSISAAEFDKISNKPIQILSDISLTINSNVGSQLICAGAHLNGIENGQINLAGKSYSLQANLATKQSADMERYAMSYLNAPYLWGGKSPFGIDCSGFAQTVFKMSGLKIPRDAYQQAELGEVVSFIELAELGDLAFFDNAEGRINHVGIVLEPGVIIHASGKVKIENFDRQGIYSVDTKKYTHNLRLVKRYI